MSSDALRTSPSARSGRRVSRDNLRGLEQGFILLLAGGLAAAVNALFSLIFLHVSGVVNYSSAAPLLTVGSVAATASVGLEYVLTVRIVASRSLRSARRSVQRIAVWSTPFFLLTPLVMWGLHYHSVLDVVLAIALAIASFAQAVPNAMLLAYGRLWSLGLVAAAEAVVRILAFLPWAHRHPVTAALVISLLVTVLGALVMVEIARRRGSVRPASEAPAPSGDTSQTLAKTLIGPLLFAPFAVPVWLAKAYLDPSGVARLSVAAFLASGVVLVLGPLTSSAIPHVVDPSARKYLRHARWMVVGLGSLAAILVAVLGPITVNLYFSRGVHNLGWLMIPLAVSAMGWALAGFTTWIGMAMGRPAPLYVIALSLALLTQILVAVVWHTVLGLACGPVASLGATAVVLLLGPRLSRRASGARR
ncbi:MAG: hypothetical protein KGR42_02385 [Acidobacteria bacterium]|nr:hypothetical protein [Acidobacteriota bacterium]